MPLLLLLLIRAFALTLENDGQYLKNLKLARGFAPELTLGKFVHFARWQLEIARGQIFNPYMTFLFCKKLLRLIARTVS